MLITEIIACINKKILCVICEKKMPASNKKKLEKSQWQPIDIQNNAENMTTCSDAHVMILLANFVTNIKCHNKFCVEINH